MLLVTSGELLIGNESKEILNYIIVQSISLKSNENSILRQKKWEMHDDTYLSTVT